MKLSEIISEKVIFTNIDLVDKEKVLLFMLESLHQNKLILDYNTVKNLVMTRERVMSTGVGGGLAIPHAKTDQVDEVKIAIATSKDGIKYKAIDGKDVYVIFMLIAPKNSSSANLKLLATIAQMFRSNPGFVNEIAEIDNSHDIIKKIREEEKKQTIK